MLHVDGMIEALRLAGRDGARGDAITIAVPFEQNLAPQRVDAHEEQIGGHRQFDMTEVLARDERDVGGVGWIYQKIRSLGDLGAETAFDPAVLVDTQAKGPRVNAPDTTGRPHEERRQAEEDFVPGDKVSAEEEQSKPCEDEYKR